jgi:Cu(I)-responsive transcriptional regulator
MTSTAIASAPVNIGNAAEQSGVSAKMIRYYESLGMLGKVRRTDSGYRQYSPAEVHVLRFIKRARDLGFSMAEISELVSLWNNRRRTSASVKRIAQKHADELAQRVAALQEMQAGWRLNAHLLLKLYKRIPLRHGPDTRSAQTYLQVETKSLFAIHSASLKGNTSCAHTSNHFTRSSWRALSAHWLVTAWLNPLRVQALALVRPHMANKWASTIRSRCRPT